MATAVVISGTSTFRNLLGNDGCGVGRRNGCSVCKNSVKKETLKRKISFRKETCPICFIKSKTADKFV